MHGATIVLCDLLKEIHNLFFADDVMFSSWGTVVSLFFFLVRRLTFLRTCQAAGPHAYAGVDLRESHEDRTSRAARRRRPRLRTPLSVRQNLGDRRELGESAACACQMNGAVCGRSSVVREKWRCRKRRRRSSRSWDPNRRRKATGRRDRLRISCGRQK